MSPASLKYFFCAPLLIDPKKAEKASMTARRTYMALASTLYRFSGSNTDDDRVIFEPFGESTQNGIFVLFFDHVRTLGEYAKGGLSLIRIGGLACIEQNSQQLWPAFV